MVEKNNVKSTKPIEYHSAVLERIFWKTYEINDGNEIQSLNDMGVDNRPIAIEIGATPEFVTQWITTVRKEMDILDISI